MEQEGLKQVKEVFKDYKAINKELIESKIKSMNLFKKTNSLEIILITNEDIKIRDVESFENYLKTRFGIKTIITKIEDWEYEDIDPKEFIKQLKRLRINLLNLKKRLEDEYL